MQHQILGTTLQTLEMILQPGEMVFSQTHQMAWMSDGVTMDTNTGGGVMKGLMRSISGGSLFVTHFTASPGAGPALVAFCPRFPGSHDRPPARARREPWSAARRRSCAPKASIQLDVFFRQQIGSGIFGGEGFILQRVTGPGWVFLDLSAARWWRRRCGPASACKSTSATSACRTRRSSSGSRGSKESATWCSAATASSWRL